MSDPAAFFESDQWVPVVVGIVIVISVLFVFLNLLVDVVNALLDPRISLVKS